jgi:hypothetical protein
VAAADGQPAAHFGTDASLDAATTQEMTTWLTASTPARGKRARPPPPEDRITRAAWFVREHREVPADLEAPRSRAPPTARLPHPSRSRRFQ